MLSYPINIVEDDNGTFLATSPDFPELTTHGEDRDDCTRASDFQFNWDIVTYRAAGSGGSSVPVLPGLVPARGGRTSAVRRLIAVEGPVGAEP